MESDSLRVFLSCCFLVHLSRRILQQRLGQIAEGRYIGPAADRVTCEELVEGLLTDYEVNGKKSLRVVRIRVNLHLAPFFAGKRAHDITTTDVKAFIARRQAEQASNGEINRELAALKRMFNLALQEEKILRKPYFPHLEDRNVRQGFFEKWEFEAVLARLPEHLRPPITWAFYTGWRSQSEILPLTWDRVDLEAGTVRLYKGTTKNKDGRVIALPLVPKAILDQQWQEPHVYPQCQYVFHRYGQRIKDFRGSWDRACQEAGMSAKKLVHDFRRTAVRNLVRAGVPERVAMAITGHKTRDIFDRYNIVSAGDLEEAARRVDEWIAGHMGTTLDTTAPSEQEHPHLNH
jgi:integrase